VSLLFTYRDSALFYVSLPPLLVLITPLQFSFFRCWDYCFFFWAVTIWMTRPTIESFRMSPLERVSFLISHDSLLEFPFKSCAPSVPTLLRSKPPTPNPFFGSPVPAGLLFHNAIFLTHSYLFPPICCQSPPHLAS